MHCHGNTKETGGAALRRRLANCYGITEIELAETAPPQAEAMSEFLQVVASLREQMQTNLSRSDVLKPLAWLTVGSGDTIPIPRVLVAEPWACLSAPALGGLWKACGPGCAPGPQ